MNTKAGSPREPRGPQAYGYTLVETLLVVVIVGLIMAMSLPRLQAVLVKQNVHGNRNKLLGIYAQARLLAMQQSRTTEIRLNSNQVLVMATPRRVPVAGSSYDTVSAYDANSEFGVTLTATPALISINPRGYGAAEATLISSKDDYADTVIISQYGRVLK